MPTGVEITSEFNESRLQGVIYFIARGTTNGYVEVYPAPRVAIGDSPLANRLVKIIFNEPIGTLLNGQLHVTPTAEYVIENTGIGAWARVFDGNGVLGFQCDVSDTLGDGQLKLQSTSLFAGGTARISSGIFV